MNLTKAQQHAVESDAQYIAILAGAGSGKTKTLTERICHLITEKGIKPTEILALTFSVKAAQEMKKRIINNLGNDAKGLMVKTFHSFGLDVLRKYYNNFPSHNTKFEIIDSSSKMMYVKNILRRYKSLVPPEEAINNISRIKNKIIQCDKDFEPIFESYNIELRNNNLVDLDDLIWLTVDLLKKDDSAREYLHNKFKHVLLDEYQDSNDIQNEMVNLILSPTASLCIVGDDDQCIYEWRGSKPQYIREFSKRKDVETIFLSDNFRSQKYVVELANKFIRHNKNRVEKQMSPRLDISVRPEFYKTSGEATEAQLIANMIKKLASEQMTKYRDIAILVRRGKQIQPIITALKSIEIPVSKRNENHNEELISFIRVLYAIINYKLNNNISVAINFPNTSLSNFQYLDLIDDYELDNGSVLDVLEQIYQADWQWETCNNFRSRYKFIKEMNEKYNSKNYSAVEILKEVLAFYESESNISAEFKENLNMMFSVLRIAEEWEKNSDNNSLDDFVDYIVCSLENEEELMELCREDAVNIMTCHQAKGLEFETVFIPGVHVGNFPNNFFIHNENELEQERRLFYVAITRAVKNLIITCYQNQYGTGNNKFIVNDFVCEIPELMEWRNERQEKEKQLYNFVQGGNDNG